ncbi:MAG: metal ABC transporter substrate-binding protein [Lachnospiraceae bacterium]|nr:metal ABC transporter substrate-binding protein [Lachnospiraceae bacterium]
MLRKSYKWLIIALISAAILCGCTAGGPNRPEGEKLRIVTTIFPEYDWVRQILGDRAGDADITLLMENGVDLHSYQPAVDDIIRISDCDLFIYVGGESDEWADDALKEAVNKDMVVLNLMDILADRVKEEETVEGMQAEEDEHTGESYRNAGDEEAGESQHDARVEYDEHVWLSLRNASVICDKIAEALSGLDPANADHYRSNAKNYREKLEALDERFGEAAKGSVKTLLFGDRFPFRYLTEDYGLDYYAAFTGCSAETEASFETVIFLAGKVNELELPVILTIDGSDGRIAETVRDNTKSRDQEILTLDSMQSVTQKDISDGVTYISIMENNLKVLEKSLK